jgi:hypothetical protein
MSADPDEVIVESEKSSETFMDIKKIETKTLRQRVYDLRPDAVLREMKEILKAMRESIDQP